MIIKKSFSYTLLFRKILEIGLRSNKLFHGINDVIHIFLTTAEQRFIFIFSRWMRLSTTVLAFEVSHWPQCFAWMVLVDKSQKQRWFTVVSWHLPSYMLNTLCWWKTNRNQPKADPPFRIWPHWPEESSSEITYSWQTASEYDTVNLETKKPERLRKNRNQIPVQKKSPLRTQTVL